MRHGSDHLDTLALHALDLLEGDERALVEEHIRSGCSTCETELRELQEMAASLAFASPAVEPPSALRDKVLARVAAPAQLWKQWKPDEEQDGAVVRSRDGLWEEIQPGITVKRLHADPGQDSVTMLIRMAPGTSYAPHRHAGSEQCYVLEGDLCTGDLLMHAGDYQCMPAGSSHGVQSTEAGCLLLIVSSTRDELIV
jgi:quercetin dioxygenase-like cupin family protein